jgi:hypothetical protein
MKVPMPEMMNSEGLVAAQTESWGVKTDICVEEAKHDFGHNGGTGGAAKGRKHAVMTTGGWRAWDKDERDRDVVGRRGPTTLKTREAFWDGSTMGIE